jgi:coproporphyrinogen III oxidase-like Fe-S oxidoreductase
MLAAAGYVEYAVSSFAKVPEHHFRGELFYFTMSGDVMGFGVSARSTLGHQFMFNGRRDLMGLRTHDLRSYFADPISMPTKFRIEPENPSTVMFHLLTTALMTEGGIKFANVSDVLGVDFAELRAHPMIRGFLDIYTRAGAEFVETDNELFLTPETRSLGNIAVVNAINDEARRNTESLSPINRKR